METYTDLKELVENPSFHEQRERILTGLGDDMIDAPLSGGRTRISHG